MRHHTDPTYSERIALDDGHEVRALVDHLAGILAAADQAVTL